MTLVPTPPRRDSVLREVIATLDERLDGHLPLDVPGVEATYRDAGSLVSALHLRWHATLTGQVAAMRQSRPEDPEAAVERAWRETARVLPGVRLALDRWLVEATGDELARAHRRQARAHQWLAEQAELAAPSRQLDETSVRLGSELEERARLRYERRRPGHRSLVQRLRSRW